MRKLYMRDSGILRYHEAWLNGDTIYEHWGIAGERGEVKEHPLPKGRGAEDAISGILAHPSEAGFSPITPEDHATLVIEFALRGKGSRKDLDKRHALEDRLNETLGWTGLGMCDGGSFGSGTIDVCCLVVDFDIAKRTIEADLAGTPYSDFTRIYNENEDA